VAVDDAHAVSIEVFETEEQARPAAPSEPMVCAERQSSVAFGDQRFVGDTPHAVGLLAQVHQEMHRYGHGRVIGGPVHGAREAPGG
jgi:hypothetical protein